MSSTASAPPLRIEPAPSRSLRAVLLAAYGGTFAITLLLVPLGPWWKGGIAAALLVDLLRTLRRHCARQGRSALRAARFDGAAWRVQDVAGAWFKAETRPDTLVFPWLVILRFRVAGRRRALTLILPADTLSADLHRRLRALLRTERRGGAY